MQHYLDPNLCAESWRHESPYLTAQILHHHDTLGVIGLKCGGLRPGARHDLSWICLACIFSQKWPASIDDAQLTSCVGGCLSLPVFCNLYGFDPISFPPRQAFPLFPLASNPKRSALPGSQDPIMSIKWAQRECINC